MLKKSVRIWMWRIMKLSAIGWCVLRLNSLVNIEDVTSTPGQLQDASQPALYHHRKSNRKGLLGVSQLPVRLEKANISFEDNAFIPIDKAFRHSVETDGKTRRLPDRFMISFHREADKHLQFILTPKFPNCDPDTKLLVLIKSALLHYQQRNVIRKTWGSNTDVDEYKVRFLFLLGQPRQNESIFGDLVQAEGDEFDDVIAGDFTDTYRNVTKKALMGLAYAAKYCIGAEFLLSVDDDVFVNIRKTILDYFTEFRRPASRKLQCGLQTVNNAKVTRRGKWAVEEAIYDKTFYPPYCLGPCYLMTLDVAGALHRASLQMPNDLPIDDVMVTGILREKIGLYLTSMRKGLCEHLGNPYNVTDKLLQAWKMQEHV